MTTMVSPSVFPCMIPITCHPQATHSAPHAPESAPPLRYPLLRLLHTMLHAPETGVGLR